MPTTRATVSEMAIVLHWGQPLERSAQVAFDLREAWRARYPKVELLPKIAPDANSAPEFLMVAAPEPRWIFVSEDEVFALQFQDTVFGVNWRKRTPVGEEPIIRYPGFDAMHELLSLEFSEFMRQLEALGHPPPKIETATLFYDNMWLLPDGVTPVAEVFSFWKTLGIPGPILGPEVRFTALLDMGSEQPARVEVISSLGLILNEEKGRRAARVQLNGIAPLTDGNPLDAVATLHGHIADLYQRVTTEAVRVA